MKHLIEEPVRKYIYSAAVAIAAVLVTAGVVKDESLLTAVLTALPVVLAVPAVEKARTKVTPTSKVVTAVEDISTEAEGR